MSEDGFEEWISSSNATDSKCTSTIAAATTSLSLAPTLQSSEDDKELKIKRLKVRVSCFKVNYWGARTCVEANNLFPPSLLISQDCIVKDGAAKDFKTQLVAEICSISTGHPPVADVRSLTHYMEP
ncbi:hypothetical protein CsatB_008563 [Cannabis sativa]